MTGCKPDAIRFLTRRAMTDQFFAVDTLVPPNFITTQGDSAISEGAPSVALELKSASIWVSVVLMLVLQEKKNPPGCPRGFVDNVQTLLLAGTIAARTHAPLARHLFCMFFRIDRLDALAHYVGDIKLHCRSRANLPAKVKF